MRRLLVPVLVCVVSLTGTPMGSPAVAQQERVILNVRLDEATVVRLPSPAQTLIIGNPAIADAVVHDGSTLIVTGKSFGTTNLIALDRRGQVLAERQIHVGQPDSSMLTVQRGDELETYACAPTCRRAPTIGDATRVFDPTMAQTSARNGLAAGQIR
jgi:hypothetical protein